MTLILSGTDGLSDIDGSAATPAIRGTDANTGIFFPAADTIAFSEGGVEVMRITSAGGVSFGSTGTAYGTSGQVLTSAGNASPTWTTPGGIAPTIQVFTSTGTYTKPTGLKAAWVRLVGGGGGAASANSTDTTADGGGGGGYSEELLAAASIGATETVTIGTAGTGGTSGGNGTAGGTTSFGALLSATGGAGGVSPRADSGTAGGTGSGGNVNIPGGRSQREDGGSSLLGLGGGPNADDRDGSSGGLYGGGGGAPINPNNGPTGRNAGNGAAGIVIVIEFY
jgi:hypothetical protein